jgi:peptidyl-prolyl cis-trans isomerase SurA
MKKILFSIAVLNGLWAAAQPLFTYGTKTVSKEEFLRQFNRNLNPAEDRSKAIQEYLPLYINYKLKVQDAYDKKLDTEYTQIAELAEFRRQIEDNYFSQEANLDDLVKEAATRSQQDIQLQDVYIGFNSADPKSADSAAAQAEKAYQKLKAGTAFEKVVEEFGTDADLKATNGQLGWVTVFSLPYRVESEVYALPAGGYTQPIRTRNAYHIFRKMAERKAIGKVRVAQILLPFPPQATPEARIALQQQGDSVYRLLQNGADFGKLAAQVSNDKTSYQNGGQLPPFGIGTYEKPFEEAAFALQKTGAISQPFTTSYGIHILKLLGKDAVPAIGSADAAWEANLRQQVASDNRMEQAKVALVKSLLPKIGYQPNKLLSKDALWQYTDSSLAGRKPALKVNDKTELFHFAKQSIKAADWLKFVTALRNGGQSKGYTDLMDTYLNATAAEYYKKHLDDYNPEFKNQMQEFKDANLNFEVTQKMVWEKAAADSAGLQRFYAANKAKYQWGPSVNAIIITGTDKNSADSARLQLEKDIKNWRPVVNSMETRLLADSNRFEQNQVPLPANTTMKLQAKTFTPMVLNPQDSSMTFCYIVDVIDQPGQRSFEEARGFVINDYQEQLETRWLEALKKKYPVKVNNTIWSALVKK